jgi:preprotein translocase subunit SecY
MPIIFASSLMMFPPIVLQQLERIESLRGSAFLVNLQAAFGSDSFTYNVLFVVMIFAFAYFWTTVQFQPKDMAKRLRDSGSFIPGLRPGHRTAEYLETVMIRITYFGAAFLAVIAVVPSLVVQLMGVEWTIATFLGGTGLLIVVSVSLDMVQRIEANLVMRHYEGFTDSGRIKGAYR